ncbi:unnamed protein product [Alopecurus aequalis]
MADVENLQDLLDEWLMQPAVAEPDERSRYTAMVLVAVLALSLTVIALVLIDGYVDDEYHETSRLTVPALVVGILVLAVAFCVWFLLFFILGELEIGNPEGSRLVDTLLSI